MARKNGSGGRRIFRFIAIAIFALFLSSLLYVLVCKWVMPPITLTQIGALTEGYGLKRDYVSWDKIPRTVKLAAIASEDQLFPEHGGFDWKSIEKSINAKPGRKKRVAAGGGASTISQQTAKNVFLWQGSGATRYIRKVPEFYFTKLIEWTWGKRRIMEVYLNVIEMGPGIFGIEAASKAYFNKHAKDLTPTEAAMIIACLPNPKKYTVRPASKMVQFRSVHILGQMGNLEGDNDVDEVIRTP